VSNAELVKDVRRILAATLDEIVELPVASVGDPRVVNQWLMRDECKAALVAYGVSIERDHHDDVQLRGSVQESMEPEIPVSGAYGYRLGHHFGWTLAAMPPVGEVWAVDSSPSTGQLADNEIIRVNSSVAAFVDLSWRWHALRPALLRLSDSDEFFEAAEIFLACLPEIDGALADEERYPWWRSLILGW
jgi:hypothetical protein